METNERQQLYAFDEQRYIPQLSIDCVVFGFHEQQLKVLLVNMHQTPYWALPGGFIQQNEDVDDAAARILFQRTGAHDIYLEQFYAFGKVNRNFTDVHRQIMAQIGLKAGEDHWIFRRFVSLGYYALVHFPEVDISSGMLKEPCAWFDVHQVPALIFDHNEIVQKALETLQRSLDEKLVGFKLLPETFTMGELQSLYETILGVRLLRTNFQRKILSMQILERTEKRFSGGAHKAPYLYRFIPKLNQI
ncbi:MAG: NUDIX domain-containing protein [Bacteroidetes bacterium]|nr:NUDIX domain-containing protein [Bacteroidota bacterium]